MPLFTIIIDPYKITIGNPEWLMKTLDGLIISP